MARKRKRRWKRWNGEKIAAPLHRFVIRFLSVRCSLELAGLTLGLNVQEWSVSGRSK